MNLSKRPFRKLFAHALWRCGFMAAAGLAAALLTQASVTLADSNSWSMNGYTLNGSTNPLDYNTSDPRYTYYRAASFSSTPNGGAWVGAYQVAGDVCGDGRGSFSKQTAGWNWSTYGSVYAMTSWVNAENCGYTSHAYRITGSHNLHPTNNSFNIGGATVTTG